MQLRFSVAFALSFFSFVLSACPGEGGGDDAGIPVDGGDTPDAGAEPDAFTADDEAEVQLLPLSAEAASNNLEYSGLGWFGDVLILLPEFSNGAFAIEKDAIEAHLDGTADGPLSPTAIPIFPEINSGNVPNYDGFEAITFVGNTVYAAIETSGPQGGGGYLLRGTIEDDLSAITFDLDTLTENQTPVPAESNSSYEAIVAVPDGLLTLFELNGALVNATPTAVTFDNDLGNRTEIAAPHLEYRITDATRLDTEGRFWAMNFRFPGDGREAPDPEALVDLYGQGQSHALYEQVERLVEFQYREGSLTRVDRPPLQFFLPADWTVDGSRNWEGVVRLDDRGFIVVTDRFPSTMLGFVPFPGRE